MNKQNMVLVLAFMVFGVMSTRPMFWRSGQDDKARIEQIRNLSKRGALSPVLYFIDGKFNNDVLQSDIELFEKDSASALSKKSWAQGYLYSSIVPGFGKLMGFGSGIGALAAVAAAGFGGYHVYDIWNIYNQEDLKNTAKGVGSSLIDFVTPGLSKEVNQQYDNVLKKSSMWDRNKYLLKTTPKGDEFEKAEMLTVGGTIGALMLAGISKYIFNEVSSYNNKNARLIQDLQEQYEQDQVVIAQLKQIQYDISHGR